MIHGGDIITYKNKFKGEIIDFSSNINPMGPPAGLREVLDKAYCELSAYPDIQYRELKENIAKYLGCRSSEVVLGSGALEIISNLCHMFKRTVVFTPCFSEYIKRAAVIGREVIIIPLSQDFKIDVAMLKTILKKDDILILGNPNNPTGLRIPENQLQTIYDTAIDQGAFLLLDEAFFEFCPRDYDSIQLFKGRENICIIRAATKFFALPGIRLGYGAGTSAFAEKYSWYESPWSINSYANAAGRCIFNDACYIENVKELISNEREYMFGELSNIKWVKAYNSHTNFILIKLLKYDENIVFYKFINSGIMIRKASNFTGLDSSYIRVAVKDRLSNEKLIKLFKELG